MSERASTVVPCACSGERYCAVPIDRVGLRHRGRGVGDGPGDAEVHHLDVATLGEHHVGRLDVAVDDAHPVAVVQRREDALGDAGGLVGVHRGLLVQDLAQGLALHQLHDDVGQRDRRAPGLEGLVLAGVVDRDDGGVVEPGRGLGLAAEPGQECGVAGQVRAQHLDGDGAPEAGVLAGVDLGHATPADEAADLVATAEQSRRAVHVRPFPVPVVAHERLIARSPP